MAAVLSMRLRKGWWTGEYVLLLSVSPPRRAILVFSSRDIVFKVLAKGMNPKKTKVSEIASKPVVCIDKESDMDDAATLMEKSNIARLFVCDEGKIIGLVSLLDVMAAELIAHARGDHVS
jgi:CBS domain-containing protein